MADKATKRKAFDIPILDDIDEVVQVTPVFMRRSKTRKQEECKTGVSEPETSKTARKLTAKSNGEIALIPAPRRPEIETEKAPSTSVETPQSGADVTEASKKGDESGNTVGSNFLETFAFIENTKYYEAPPSKASTSKFSETA